MEVTSSNAEKIPQSPESQFIHRQSLANVVRFTTPELSDLDTKISEPQMRLAPWSRVFSEKLVKNVMDCSEEISCAAGAIACIDVILSLASLAISKILFAQIFHLIQRSVSKGGRHPVVEHVLRPLVRIVLFLTIAF